MQFSLFMLSFVMFATLLILYWHSMTHPHDVAPFAQPARKATAPPPRG